MLPASVGAAALAWTAAGFARPKRWQMARQGACHQGSCAASSFLEKTPLFTHSLQKALTEVAVVRSGLEQSSKAHLEWLQPPQPHTATLVLSPQP